MTVFLDSRMRLAFVSLLFATSVTAHAGSIIADFEDLSLAPDSYNAGPMPNAQLAPGPWGEELEGTFQSGGVDFINRQHPIYESWSRFAYSNQGDTSTPGYLNQFSSSTGGAHSGSNFGVAYGYHDLEANGYQPEGFDPTRLDHLEGLPYFTLPLGASIEGMFVTNTTYTVLSLKLSDSFSTRPFGGENGDIPDWYKITAFGTDAAGNILDASVDFFLADNRLGQLFIAEEWLYMDLSALADANRLYFNLSGTIGNDFGLTIPAYFAMDDVSYAFNDNPVVPEPTSLVLASLGTVALGIALRRRAA